MGKNVTEMFLDRLVDQGRNEIQNRIIRPVVSPISETTQRVEDVTQRVEDVQTDLSSSAQNIDPAAFSSNDVIYVAANAPSLSEQRSPPVSNPGSPPVSNVGSPPASNQGSSEAALQSEFTEKTKKLSLLKESYKLTQRQNADFNISQNALILNNVTLGIGILTMMWIVY